MFIRIANEQGGMLHKLRSSVSLARLRQGPDELRSLKKCLHRSWSGSRHSPRFPC